MMHVSRGARAALVGLLACALLVSAGPALADEGQEPRVDNRARAQQLFDSALADAEAGNLASACPKFLASQEADPKASTLLNLASCYEKNGQTASAWGAFREAEGLARKVGRSDWETSARTHAEELEPKLVKLTVTVPEPSRVPGLVVTRDGARLATGEWGVAIPVDPGEHVIEASSAGYVPWELKSTVRETSGTVSVPVLEPVPVVVEPPVQVPTTPARPAEPRTWWTPMRTAGVAVAGVGVVALVTGSVLGLVAKGNYDDARDRCTDGARGCPSGAIRDSNSAYGTATGATVVFVVGAVAAASGVALVLLSPLSDKATGTAKTSGGLRASIQMGPGSVGVAGRW
jgi:hypothetical protein